jgi:hypothetical protein
VKAAATTTHPYDSRGVNVSPCEPCESQC